jgi:hypothetical protein
MADKDALVSLLVDNGGKKLRRFNKNYTNEFLIRNTETEGIHRLSRNFQSRHHNYELQHGNK